MSENESFVVADDSQSENVYSNAFSALERYDDLHLKIFIKQYLQSGIRYPFPRPRMSGTFYYLSLVKLISLYGNLILEERIKRTIRELLLESQGEFSEARSELRGVSYNRFEYLFNLVGASTHLQYFSDDQKKGISLLSIDILYSYAYNGNFMRQYVYGLNLHKFILQCLFSFNFPSSYEEKILILCEENIYFPICAPLCYREAYEINHLNAIMFLNNYLGSARELDKNERLDPLSYIHLIWAKKLFKKYSEYFVKQIYRKILKFKWLNDLESINFDLNLRNMDLREDACILELRIDDELIFGHEIVDIDIIKDIKKYHKIEPANSMLFGDPKKLNDSFKAQFGSGTTSKIVTVEAES